MGIKTGLFFFLTFCYIINSNFWYITSLLYYGKCGKNKSKLRIIYPKNHENFKNSMSRPNFTGFYFLKNYQVCVPHYGNVIAYTLACVLMVFTYHLKHLWLLLCPLFVIGKHWTILGLLKIFIWYWNKSNKIRGVLGLFRIEMCGGMKELYGAESMTTL